MQSAASPSFGSRDPPLLRAAPDDRNGERSDTLETKATQCLSADRVAVAMQIAAALIWIPQAAVLSFAVGEIVSGPDMTAMLASAAAIFVLGSARALLDAAGSRQAFLSARRVLSLERARAVAAISATSPIDATKASSGFAASAIVEQAEAISLYLVRFQPARHRAVVVPLVILACVLPFSWLVASLLLISAPLIPIFMALIGWRAKAASERQLGEMGNMNAFLIDRLRGLATIRALGAVDATAVRVRAEAESVRVRTMAVLRIAFLSSAMLELFAALGVAMVAVYVGFHFLDQLDFGAWGDKLSLAEGLFVLLLAPAFFEPLRDLSAAWHDRAAGEAAIEVLSRLNVNDASLLGAGGTGGENLAPAIVSEAVAVKVEALCYRHRGRRDDVFDGLNLSVAPGEHVAVLAPSGGGKSTLLAIIAGLAAPTAGRIWIDETVLDDANARSLRRRMAWIGQAPHIFAGSLAANVSLRRPDVTSDRAVAALEAMQLGDVLKRRASAIGEGGIGLSGGEALRLALARIAAAPEAGLILADEPTAHLDSGTARDIVEALKSLAQHRTLIVATHDPVVAARMDRVVRIATESNETVA